MCGAHRHDRKPVGAVSNPDHMNESHGQGGLHARRGTRPTVRSIAMNPVDHPNGGRTKGGKQWATPGQEHRREDAQEQGDGIIVRGRAIRQVRTRDVSRSVWKGPFVDGYLLKKGGKRARISGRNEIIRICEPALDDPTAVCLRPDLRGVTN